jgi:hypothetical protein
MSKIPDDNVVAMFPGAVQPDPFEHWLETGDAAPYGPAVMVLLSRARETILAHRESAQGAPKAGEA